MVKTKRFCSAVLSLMLLISALFSAGTVRAASEQTVEGKYNYSYASEVLTLVNKERQQYGLQPLTMTKALTDGAMLRAAECTVSFSHTRPNGEQCFTAFDWTRTAGENIAYGQRSPAQVMNGWMNSSGHRANILNASFTTIGIGCFEYHGTLYWAQAFSGGNGSAYTPTGTRAVKVKISGTAGVPSTVTFLEETTTEKATQPTTEPAPPTTQRETTTKERTTAPGATKSSTAKETTTRESTTKSAAPVKTRRSIFSRFRYIITYFFR